MFSRLAGVWFAIVVIAAWSAVCLLLGLGSDPARLIAVLLLWLVVVAPFSWAIWRQRRL